MTQWAAALDRFEQRLVDQRAALDRGEAGEVPPFEPPAGLGPIPPSLVPRASGLLTEAQDLEAELAGALTALAQDLAVVRRVEASAGRTTGVSHFLDTAL